MKAVPGSNELKITQQTVIHCSKTEASWSNMEIVGLSQQITPCLCVQICCEQEDLWKSLKIYKDKERAGEREGDGWANLAHGLYGIQFSFPACLVFSQSSNPNPASAFLKLHFCVSCRERLFLKSLHLLIITARLTLVLFSRSVCTSFWDPPRSQYSLS